MEIRTMVRPVCTCSPYSTFVDDVDGEMPGTPMTQLGEEEATPISTTVGFRCSKCRREIYLHIRGLT